MKAARLWPPQRALEASHGAATGALEWQRPTDGRETECPPDDGGEMPVVAENAALRRACDLAGAALLLGVTAPVMVATAVALLFLEGRPIFYTQARTGLRGAAFRIVKFRTMRRDAEADGRARWASAQDPRITRVGKLLRRTRIDELPQLVNVLRGEMSLVGPRPERPEFVATLSRELPGYAHRLAIKPGITGWAQVRCPYAGSIAESETKLRYDLDYMRHRSVRLDLRILLETVRVVLKGEGAR